MFAFSLQDVLDFRKQVQEDRERDYERAAALLNQAKSELQQLDQERQDTARNLLTQSSKDWNAYIYRLYHNYQIHLKERISQQYEAISQQESVLKDRRAELMEAMREVEIMDNLREQEWREYEYQERKKDEKLMSELGLFNYTRRALRENA